MGWHHGHGRQPIDARYPAFHPASVRCGFGLGAAAVGGQWTLRRAINDETERYDANGVLQQIQYRNGQTKTLTYSDASTPTNIAPGPGYLIGIKDAFGKALSLRYDSYGRLATLTDPAGQAVTYGYELAQPRWNCTSADCFRIKTVTYQDGKTKTYHWDEADYNPNATTQRNLLTGVTDENSQRYSTIRYDSKGQAMSTELAGGVFRYTFSNLQPRTSVTVTDPLGTARTFNFVNAAGLTQLSSLTGAACDDCGPASATYDSKGNVASQTDFNGTVTCFGYDLTRNLETARVEGLPAGTACRAVWMGIPFRPARARPPRSGTRCGASLSRWPSPNRPPPTRSMVTEASTVPRLAPRWTTHRSVSCAARQSSRRRTAPVSRASALPRRAWPAPPNGPMTTMAKC